MTPKRDLVILGGGLVGMTLALAAARAGLTSHVVDRADPAELTAEGVDGRASLDAERRGLRGHVAQKADQSDRQDTQHDKDLLTHGRLETVRQHRTCR